MDANEKLDLLLKLLPSFTDSPIDGMTVMLYAVAYLSQQTRDADCTWEEACKDCQEGLYAAYQQLEVTVN